MLGGNEGDGDGGNLETRFVVMGGEHEEEEKENEEDEKEEG